ncbi:DUF2254 domain-containing protein [Arthrobacter burdickii]|uniref:DUF2254 domain-containing protein n=1 Tax=Arthrobacter burdickii TaxID=3035920 RepID=A0ABT8K3C6_9MICC|nr:DUF2254 domain-containing protein [Arthrobacter burdickii]MDN4610874.1 DUF2254 domain-containing protein [Arthrobacter burdickii]
MSSGTRSRFAGVLRATLWFWPFVAAVVSLVLTVLLLMVRPDPAPAWAMWLWPSGVDAAMALLQVVAGSIMTATTLIFSLTVLALQLASQQFSPRLLREFARDRVTQAVLGILMSTFVVSVTGLRGMDADRPLPVLVPALVFVMGLGSAGALLFYVGHIVRSLRVDTMMLAVHREASRAARQAYPEYEDHSSDLDPDLPGPAGGTLVAAPRSGFVKAVRPEGLVQAATTFGVFVQVGVRPGDRVTVGTPLGSMWTDGGGDVIGSVADQMSEAVAGAVEMGFERTLEQDPALGLRQLTDIAVKAISPAINDPITAVHAVGHCADLLVQLQGCRLGSQQHNDDHGTPRVVTPDRDHRYYLNLVCGPVRRFGGSEPLVLSALLRLLRDCAVSARDNTQREAIRAQVGLILESMDPGMLPYDADAVHDLAARVELVLHGNTDGAYRDRAGETRSV